MEEQGFRGTRDIITERKKRILSIRTLVFFLFSALCTWLLLTHVDISLTLAALASVKIEYVLLCLLCYCVSTYFKALRFNVILKKSGITVLQQWAVCSYHNFFNMIFPARTGELTFIYYTNKFAGVPLASGLHALLATRFLDLVVVAGVFIVTFFIHFGKKVSIGMLISAVALALVSLAALVFMPVFLRISVRVFDFLCSLLKIDKIRIIAKISLTLHDAAHEFENYDAIRDILPLVTTSLLTWLALYTMFYFSILAFGVNIEYHSALLGSTGAVLTNVLPINSFGSFGTLEAGWTGGFVMVGMKMQDAVTTGFGSHLINFFASIVLALVTAAFRLLSGLNSNNKHSAE